MRWGMLGTVNSGSRERNQLSALGQPAPGFAERILCIPALPEPHQPKSAQANPTRRCAAGIWAGRGLPPHGPEVRGRRELELYAARRQSLAEVLAEAAQRIGGPITQAAGLTCCCRSMEVPNGHR
jgi:hypothetical protein